MARAAAPASGAPAMSWRRRASPASSSSPMGRWAADFVHDPGATPHEDLWPDTRAIGRWCRSCSANGGQEPAPSPGGPPWRAYPGTPTTVEDVLSSRMIADQYAGAPERGDQAAYPCRAHLP